jgi:hypothetical protein
LIPSYIKINRAYLSIKSLFIVIAITLLSAATAFSQFYCDPGIKSEMGNQYTSDYINNKSDTTDNIKSRFGVGYGIAADLKNSTPAKNLFSFHLRFTLKPVTKYLFIEFAANIYPEYIKFENALHNVTSKTFSFAPLFGQSIINNKLLLYAGPSVDFNTNELMSMKSGFGLNFRLDYSFTRIITTGINVKYISFSGSQSSSFLLSNINMSFTL